MKPNLLRPSTVATELNISRRAVHRLMRDDPDFPAQVRLSARTVLIHRSELDAYLLKKRQPSPTLEDTRD